jgi:hypothetical protein
MKNTLPVLLSFLATAAAAQELVLATASARLLTVRLGTPGIVSSNVSLSGLASGETLVGIDYRPATGELFGLSDGSRLYRIEVGTGACTAVAGVLSPLLNGGAFGVDFNPTVDRIRVTSDADQNLRLHPMTGVVAATDTPLSYAPTDVFAAVNPNVVASAYTNNFNGATTTMLFNIDSSLDTLVFQNPPNSGVLNTVGPLGVNVTGASGFDIAGSNGAAYAVLTTPGSPAPALFSIDLTSGAARFLAVLGTTETIVGMSIKPSPGVVPYGVATPGCFGPSAIGTLGTPVLGSTNFAITCDNAHPLTAGRLALATGRVTSPITVLGFSLFVDPFSPGTIWIPMMTDAMGTSVVALSIPNEMFLRGLQLYSQFALFDRCTRAGFAASNAIAITLQ